jgi:hypothetical protein
MAVNTQAIFGVVKREGMEKGFWTRIGTAFENQDGSWNLRFDYVPTDPFATVQMRPATSAQEEASAAKAAGASRKAK